MKALTLTGIGGLEHLAMLAVPPPALRADDDVLIRVRCAALNRIDLWMTGGLPNVKPAFPLVVGSDGAGEVEAVGPGVRDWRPGDRVLINPGISCGHCAACEAGEESLCSNFGILGEHLPGTAAELVVVPAANLGRVPDGMSWSEAAAFSLATITVWHMLTARAMLHAAGFTPRLLHPSEQRELLDAGYGITNLVNRGTATADELDPEEFVAGRSRLAAKVRRYRPQALAFLGVGAYCHAFSLKKAPIGPQPQRFEGAAVWVLPNPSGLNANYQLPALVKLFRSLRDSGGIAGPRRSADAFSKRE